MRLDDEFLIKNSILTPSNLAAYIERAKANELQLFPESIKISDDFMLLHKQYLAKVQKQIEEEMGKKEQLEAQSLNESTPNSNKRTKP